MSDKLFNFLQGELASKVDRLAEIEGELIALAGGDVADGKEALERIRQKLSFAPVKRECRNCEAYDGYSCRLNAPVVVVLREPNPTDGTFIRTAWPFPEPGDWCWQFRAKPPIKEK